MTIRPYQPGDDDIWCALRSALWPEGSPDEHTTEMRALLARPERWVVLFSTDRVGAITGFVEASMTVDPARLPEVPAIRIEGWYVGSELRRQGIGRRLVAAAAAWGQERGARVLLSDAEIDNAVSLAAHAALGFEETGRIVLLRRSLD
ncbi:MAG: aminoglycoside 6'-acetyltransferase [Planctomycetes bacterium]|nr:aminoglycoside 6'-acetyltransferase [Planctomycetota bacterium]